MHEQMSQMMQHRAETQKQMPEVLGALEGKTPEKK